MECGTLWSMGFLARMLATLIQPPQYAKVMRCVKQSAQLRIGANSFAIPPEFLNCEKLGAFKLHLLHFGQVELEAPVFWSHASQSRKSWSRAH